MIECEYCKELILHGDKGVKVWKSMFFYDNNIPLFNQPQELWYHGRCFKKERPPDAMGKEIIKEFLKRLNWILERIEFHTENSDSELIDEVSEEYIKWDKRLKQ